MPSQLLSILYATITEEICSDYARKLCPSGAHDVTGCFKQNKLNELDFNDPSAIGEVLKNTGNNNGGIFIRLTTSFTHIDNFEYAYMLGHEEGGHYDEFSTEDEWMEKTGKHYIDKEFKTMYSKTLKYFKAKEYTQKWRAMTRKAYEQYLNELSDCISEEKFIMGGKMRHGTYGTMLRKYDPIAFYVGFNEWKQERLNERELR